MTLEDANNDDELPKELRMNEYDNDDYDDIDSDEDNLYAYGILDYINDYICHWCY